MGKPAINAGSSALQAYMQGVANMGQVRAQMQQNTANAINALGDTFTKWQDDFNKRKHLKWTQQMEEAKLAETKRVNDSNIDIANRGMVIKETALPHEIASLNANTDLTKKKAVAQGQENYAMGKAIKSVDSGNAWGQHAGQIISGGKVDNPNTPTPNSSSTGTTGNGVNLNNGGVNLEQSDNSNSAMGVVNGAKKQSTTATNANGYGNGYGATNYFNVINKGKA